MNLRDCMSPLSALEALTHSDEMWYKRYAIESNHNIALFRLLPSRKKGMLGHYAVCVCYCVTLFLLWNMLLGFHKIRRECYAIRGHSHVLFSYVLFILSLEE
jgi:hypothetical protein